MTVPDLVVPVDVAVVDPDLLWRVEVMNALDGLMVKDVVTVLGAMEHLTPGHPAVAVLGPAGALESAAQLRDLRAQFPEVRVVIVEGPLLEAALGELRDGPRLSLVPALADDDDADTAPAADPTVGGGAELAPGELTGVPGPVTGDAVGDAAGDAAGQAAGDLADHQAALVDRSVPAGTTLDELVVAVHQELAIARGRAGQEPDGTVFRTLADTQLIVITSAKGGDGATTVAANLAAALAAQGQAVGLVEGDPAFGDLSLLLALPVAAPGTATDPETGIRLVMPARPLEPFAPIEVDRLFDQLSDAQPPFDVVVIEAPASIADRSGLSRMADHLLVVCSSHLSSIKNAVILLEVLQHHDNLGVVVNRVGRKGLPRHQLEETLRTHVVAELPLTPELEPDRPDQAPTLAAPKSRLTKELEQLATRLTPADRRR